MKAYFFGVMHAGQAGHYMYRPNGGSVPHYEAGDIPFRWQLIDGGLMPQKAQQVQGQRHLAVINGWTVLSIWDRTGDTRGGSCSVFIFDTPMTMEQASNTAAFEFPELWKRIKPI